MKTKLFLAALAVTFSFAMMSCSGNKAANAASDTDSTAVETVEAAACTKADSCCQAKDSCAAASCCDKKTDCTEKKSCCEKK